jgi:hypothetical protein
VPARRRGDAPAAHAPDWAPSSADLQRCSFPSSSSSTTCTWDECAAPAAASAMPIAYKHRCRSERVAHDTAPLSPPLQLATVPCAWLRWPQFNTQTSKGNAPLHYAAFFGECPLNLFPHAHIHCHLLLCSAIVRFNRGLKWGVTGVLNPAPPPLHHAALLQALSSLTCAYRLCLHSHPWRTFQGGWRWCGSWCGEAPTQRSRTPPGKLLLVDKRVVTAPPLCTVPAPSALPRSVRRRVVKFLQIGSRYMHRHRAGSSGIIASLRRSERHRRPLPLWPRLHHAVKRALTLCSRPTVAAAAAAAVMRWRGGGAWGSAARCQASTSSSL